MNPETEKALDVLLCALSKGELSEAQRSDLEALLQRDAEARRRYLDYVGLDALLRRRFPVPEERSSPNRPGEPEGKHRSVSRFRRFALFLSAAACLAIGLGIWLMTGPGQVDDPGQVGTHNPHFPLPLQEVRLASGWMGESRGAIFQIVGSGVVRLDRGELFVRSVSLGEGDASRDPLRIETPAGVATATGTEFYVGHHVETLSEKGADMKNKRSRVRVLVLSGVVALANAFGTVTGGAHDVLAAEAGEAPVKETVKANSAFALDLYQQLSKVQKGRNLFFSPYSISSALAMTAEGARGETATEMGMVLRYPDVAKRMGDDAQLIPWRTSLINTGFEQINQALNRNANDPKAAAIRTQLKELRAKLAEASKATKAAEKSEKWKVFEKCRETEVGIVKQINALAPQVDQFELKVANALWAEKTCRIEEPFRKTITDRFDTGAIRAADFKGAPDAERLRINGWVEDRTEKRIKDLIPQGAIEPLTRLVLVNAIYFKGEWAEPFDPQVTANVEFTLADGSKVKAPTMHAYALKHGRYGAFEKDGTFFKTPREVDSRDNKTPTYPGKEGFAMAELPYKGKELSMLLIAPLAHDGLEGIERQLTTANLDVWLGSLEARKMDVKLPRFKLETDYQLNEHLKKMGMVRAFTNPPEPAGADFTGIHNTENIEERLYISKVLHKAFLDVNEKGTEAAAAVITRIKPGIPRMAPFTPTFSADRPFLLMIRHNETGTILFMGRVTNPSGEKVNAL